MVKFKSVKKIAVSLSTTAAMLISAMPGMPSGISNTAEAAATCTINTSKTYQSITGFGGINHPEWTGDKGGDLSEAQRATAFGNGDNQLGLTVLRVFVNPDKNQWKNAVPTAKYASEHGVTVFASPWEPPANLAESGGSKGKLHLPKQNYAAYAQHLNDFGTFMKNNGVDLYSISVQNEPDYAKEWTAWSTDETTDFLANYADKITSTRVMSPESFQYSPENASWIAGGDGGKKYYTKILNNAKAFANTDLFGTHFYGTTRDWMDFPALESCGKPIWMTEVYVPNSDANSNNKWPEAIKVAENIHNGLVIGNMSAYVWWYIRRSYGPMSDDGTISKRGYCMAQYSKYVRPGAVRIDCTEQPEKNVFVSAYKNTDGKIAVVAVNTTDNGYAQEFSFGKTIKNVDRYRTSANENLAATKGLDTSDGKFFAQLPAQSVSTFVVTLDGESGFTPADPGTPAQPTEPTPAQPNDYGWYFNHGFESDECGWAARGGTTLAVSSSEHYTDYGSKSLYVSGRTSAWNGALYELPSNTFKAGESYSFSTHVKYTDSTPDNVQFQLSLEYKGSDGETHYDHIAQSYATPGKWVQLVNTSYKIPADATNYKIYVETCDDSTVSFYMDEAIGAVNGTGIAGEGPMDKPGSPAVTPPPSETQPTTPIRNPIILGDVIPDGKVNAFDLVAAERGLLYGFKDPSAKIAADVNQDNNVGVSDIIELCKFLNRKLQLEGKNTFSGGVSVTVTTTTVTTAATTTTTTTTTKATEASKPHYSMKDYTELVSKNVSEFEPESYRQEQGGRQYGTIKKESYYSNICKRNKPYNVLLPAGYNENKKYPVLYCMHGYWENQDRMIITGNNNNPMVTRQIIGNAIADGSAEDMIVVFPYIYSSTTQDNCSGMDDNNNAAYDNFGNVLVQELMPLIESKYSVKTGKENTAITGFSMGGREALMIGMKYSDKFGYVGAICPAPGATGAFKWDSGKEPYLVFITAGSNDQTVYTTPEGYHNNFTKNNVPHIWHYVTGGYHGDNCIRAHLYNFVRNIFKA